MKWLVIAVLVLAQQPAKAPEGKGAAKSKVAQDTQQTNAPDEKKGDSGATHSPPPTVQQVAAQNPQREAAESSEDVKIQRRIEIFTGLLVIVGFLQAGVMFLQWRTYRRQAREMRRQRHEMRQQRHVMRLQWKAMQGQISQMQDTAVRELRAYVCISRASIAFTKERAPEIRLHIKNSGKTPAYDVRMWIGAGLGEYPASIPLPPPPSGFRMSSSVMGAGEEPLGLVWRHPVISEEDMPILGTPQLTLFAYGEIVYRDAFGNQRSTKYRLLHGGVEKAVLRNEGGIGVAFLSPDIQGNEAD